MKICNVFNDSNDTMKWWNNVINNKTCVVIQWIIQCTNQ